jgi:hypothetical protein
MLGGGFTMGAKMTANGQSYGIRGNWNNLHRLLNELGWWVRYLNSSSPKGTEALPR